jgi:hypothetical protein
MAWHSGSLPGEPVARPLYNRFAPSARYVLRSLYRKSVNTTVVAGLVIQLAVVSLFNSHILPGA